MELFEELSQSYPLEEVEPYGRVLVVPSKLFRLEWQKQLESEGVKVYSGAHGSQACFFLKAPACQQDKGYSPYGRSAATQKTPNKDFANFG